MRLVSLQYYVVQLGLRYKPQSVRILGTIALQCNTYYECFQLVARNSTPRSWTFSHHASQKVTFLVMSVVTLLTLPSSSVPGGTSKIFISLNAVSAAARERKKERCEHIISDASQYISSPRGRAGYTYPHKCICRILHTLRRSRSYTVVSLSMYATYIRLYTYIPCFLQVRPPLQISCTHDLSRPLSMRSRFERRNGRDIIKYNAQPN